MRGVWAGGLRLWCRSVSLRIFEKIRSQANRGRRRRNFEAECYATAVPALPCAISPYFISDGAFARALPGGQRSSPTRPNQEQLSHFARAVAFEPQSPYSPPVLIHLVAPLDVEVTACRQGAQRDRRKSIRTPRGRRLAAAGAVAETPAGTMAPQEGPTPKLEAVRGTNVAPLGTPAFRVGRRVRISFAPAESQQRTASCGEKTRC